MAQRKKPGNDKPKKLTDENEMIASEPILHDGELVAPGESFITNKKAGTIHLKNKTAGLK